MTTKKLLDFLGYASGYIKQNSKERSQLTLALHNHFISKYKNLRADVERELNEKREELEAAYCLKDPQTKTFIEKEVILPNGQVIFKKSFTAESAKKKKDDYDKFESELFEREVDGFKPYIVPVPPMIDISWVKQFYGFVFEEMSPEQESAWYLAQDQSEKEKK